MDLGEEVVAFDCKVVFFFGFAAHSKDLAVQWVENYQIVGKFTGEFLYGLILFSLRKLRLQLLQYQLQNLFFYFIDVDLLSWLDMCYDNLDRRANRLKSGFIFRLSIGRFRVFSTLNKMPERPKKSPEALTSLIHNILKCNGEQDFDLFEFQM